MLIFLNIQIKKRKRNKATSLCRFQIQSFIFFFFACMAFFRSVKTMNHKKCKRDYTVLNVSFKEEIEVFFLNIRRLYIRRKGFGWQEIIRESMKIYPKGRVQASRCTQNSRIQCPWNAVPLALSLMAQSEINPKRIFLSLWQNIK